MRRVQEHQHVPFVRTDVCLIIMTIIIIITSGGGIIISANVCTSIGIHDDEEGRMRNGTETGDEREKERERVDAETDAGKVGSKRNGHERQQERQGIGKRVESGVQGTQRKHTSKQNTSSESEDAVGKCNCMTRGGRGRERGTWLRCP